MKKEEENFFHLCICVLNLCGRICRNILLKFVPVPNSLAISRGMRLSAEQKLIVQKAVTTGNYEEFDITLIYSFLRNGCRSFPSPTAGWGKPPNGYSVSDDVERIRILRNTAYGHNHTAAIDNQIYNIHITEITDICQRMDTVHSTKIINTGIPYHQELQDILNYSTNDIALQKNFEDMKKQIQIDLQSMEQNRDDQYGEIIKIVTNVGEEVMYMRKEVQNLHFDVNDLRVAIDVPNQKRDQALFLKERTSKALHHHGQCVYTKRTALEENCLRALRSSPHLCILVGKKGSGKSSTALAVIKSFSNSSCDKYLVHSPEELNAFRNMSSKDILILIDDIEGTSSDSYEKNRSIERYTKELDVIYMYQNIRLLITTSCNVETELQTLLNNLININRFNILKNINPSDVIIFLSHFPLTMEEKRETLNRYREVCCQTNAIDSQDCNLNTECPLSESDVEEIIQSETPEEFPGACKMFFTNQTCFNLGIAFFRNTRDTLFRIVGGKCISSDKNENFEFLILCTVFFLKSVDFDEVLSVATHFRMQKPNRREVERAKTNLEFQQFIRENETQGIHEMCSFELYLVVPLVIGRYFPNIFLDFADRTLLFDLICSSSYDIPSDDICCRIPKDQDKNLARKLLDYGFDSLKHRTMSDEAFCGIFVEEMFDKYGLNSAELDENKKQILKSIVDIGCKMSHLDNFLKTLIHQLLQKEELFSQVLREALFSCISKGTHLHKVLLFDNVSDDLRRNALIEAIEKRKEEIVIHYVTTLPEPLVKSLKISVLKSSPKIVKIILRGFTIPQDEILDCLSIAVDEGKVDIVQVFVECIESEKMEGKEETITEIINRSIINHDIAILQHLTNIIYDLDISREKIFIQIVECGFSRGLSYFSDVYDLSFISRETLSNLFAKATRTGDNKFFEIFCNILRFTEIPDDDLFNVLSSAIELHSTEKVNILVHNIKFPNDHERLNDIFLKASENENGIFDVMLDSLNVKRSTIYECLHHAIMHQKFLNARLIQALCEHTKTYVPQELVQQIFLDCCRNDDSVLIRGTIDLFGKGVIENSTLQEGMLLSMGSNEIYVLEYLLREFENVWMTESVFENLIYETCRCKPKSMEKLQSVIRYAKIKPIDLATWQKCIRESSKTGNTEACIYCLEMIGDNIEESVLMDSFKYSFEIPNLEVVHFLLRNSYFEKLLNQHKKHVLISVFESKSNDMMSYVISTFHEKCFTNDIAEKIFTLLTEQGNIDMLKKLIDLIDSNRISKDIILFSFERSIENNCSEIPTFLAECFEPKFDKTSLNKMLMCSLEQENIKNIALIAGMSEIEFFEETVHCVVEVASHRIEVLRILCHHFDVSHIPEVKCIELLELAIAECDNLVFRILLENCSHQYLISKRYDLFIKVFCQGDKEIAKCFLDNVGLDFKNDYIQFAFLNSCQRDYGEILDYILAEEVFGTSHISKETLENAYCEAVDRDWKDSFEVINRRFDIPTELRKKCLTAAKSSFVRDELTKSKTGAGPVDTVLSSTARAMIEGGNPNVAKVMVEVQDAVKSAKDAMKKIVE